MNIEAIQQICRQLPAVTEDIKWDHDLVFSVGGKMFCVIGLDQQPTTASFKASEEAFEGLCLRPGFKPAPYLARYNWVWIENMGLMKKQEWQKYIGESYELVRSKLPDKVKKSLGFE